MARFIDLSWARGTPAVWPSAPKFVRNDYTPVGTISFWNGPLPDLILAPGGKVNVITVTTGGVTTGLLINNGIVVVSPNLPGDQASIVGDTPLWLRLPEDNAGA